MNICKFNFALLNYFIQINSLEQVTSGILTTVCLLGISGL